MTLTRALIRIIEEDVFACGKCNIVFNDRYLTGIREKTGGRPCPHEDCPDRVRIYSRLMLPIVNILNTSSLYVNAAEIIWKEEGTDIWLRFCDDYGHHFIPLPQGFRFDPEPAPEKHSTTFPIKLIKTLDPVFSDIQFGKAVFDALADLLDWAKRTSP